MEFFNGQTTPPHPTLCPTTPTYQVNRTCSLSHFPLSVSRSVPHAHILTFIHCFTLSQLPSRSLAQTSYTWAGSAAPLGPRNRRRTAESPLEMYSVISRVFFFYLTVLPSLVFAFCLFIPAVTAHFPPLFSARYQIANFTSCCFSSGRSYLPLFCSVAIMRFLARH